MSSVGRRMTSLIFGGGGGSTSGLMGSPAAASHFSLNKNIQNFKAALRYSNSNDLFILVEKNIQKLKINSDLSISLIGQVNIEKLIYEEYLVKMPDSYRTSVILQDASITK
jgi:hypothetical protein